MKKVGSFALALLLLAGLLSAGVRPVSSSGTLLIYEDALGGTFTDGSFNFRSRNICDGFAVSGNCSYSIALNAYGGLNFMRSVALDTSPYQSLQFTINRNYQPSDSFGVLFTRFSDNRVIFEKRLSDADISAYLDRGFVRFSIPVSVLNPANESVGQVQIKNVAAAALPTVWVDEVRLVVPPAAPTPTPTATPVTRPTPTPTPASGADKWYPFGVKPGGIPQADVRAALRRNYDAWAAFTFTNTGMPAGMPVGAYRVKVPNQLDPVSRQPNGTFSEGIGYGMFVTVYMGAPQNPVRDPSARMYFDGFWKYYRHYRNEHGLMHWRVDHNGSITGYGGATDADVDVAMSLVLAHRIWGSGGEINYQAEATTLINAILAHEFTPENHPTPNVMMNGDYWGIDTDRYMADYFAPAWFRTFAEFTGNPRWNTIVQVNYPRAIGYFYNTYSTGLVPNESRRDGRPVPDASYIYGYNAVRMPWRITTDYLWYGAAQARDNSLRLANWSAAQANGVPANLRAEYTLEGVAQGNYTNAPFVGGLTLVGTVDASRAPWAGAGAAWLRDNGREGNYFNDALGVIALLLMSGEMQR